LNKIGLTSPFPILKYNGYRNCYQSRYPQ
jgi:hypothetical protein